MIQILLQGLKVSLSVQQLKLTVDGPACLPALLRAGKSAAPAFGETADTQVCAIINACFLPFTEGLAPFRELARIGPLVMLTNAGVAFGLNVAAVFLIGAAGGLVLTLAGVFKVCPIAGQAGQHGTDMQDILLITSSCLFFGSSITPIQIFGELRNIYELQDVMADGTGYSLALGGLMAYKNASGKK